MNERIQELAYDAEDYADTMVDGGSEFHVVFVRKLAELIVQECAILVEDAVLHREPASTYANKIRKHFGVRENES